jgi:hypothetical protein
LYSTASASAVSIRRYSQVLLALSVAQLALFLGTIIQNFYWGDKHILLAVHTTLRFDQQQLHHLSKIVDSSVGLYSTGTEGRLLYHATSLWDYALFYSISGLALPDVLFLCGLGVYLHRALRQLAPGSEFSLARTSAFATIGVVTLLMFTIKLAFNVHIAAAFQTKTQHQFYLATQPSNMLYVVFGLLLLLCASFFHRGEQLQEENELTI